MLAFIAARTVSEETDNEWIQNGRMQFDDQSSVTQKDQEYRLEYQADGSTTDFQPDKFSTVLPNHMNGTRPHPRTGVPAYHRRRSTRLSSTQLHPTPAWAENLVHQLKDAKTFQVTVEAEMTEANARQFTEKDDVTPFMAVRAYDGQGTYTLNLNEALNSPTRCPRQPKSRGCPKQQKT